LYLAGPALWGARVNVDGAGPGVDRGRARTVLWPKPYGAGRPEHGCNPHRWVTGCWKNGTPTTGILGNYMGGAETAGQPQIKLRGPGGPSETWGEKNRNKHHLMACPQTGHPGPPPPNPPTKHHPATGAKARTA